MPTPAFLATSRIVTGGMTLTARAATPLKPCATDGQRSRGNGSKQNHSTSCRDVKTPSCPGQSSRESLLCHVERSETSPSARRKHGAIARAQAPNVRKAIAAPCGLAMPECSLPGFRLESGQQQSRRRCQSLARDKAAPAQSARPPALACHRFGQAALWRSSSQSEVRSACSTQRDGS